MTKRQPTWGKLRFGKQPNRSALPWAICTGLILSTILGLTAANWGHHATYWSNFSAFFAGVLPFAIAAAWLLLVDRTTIKGAVANPEHSIEHTWLAQASSISFFITIAVTGLASAIFTLFFDSFVGAALMVVAIAMLAVFAGSYLVIKHKA